LNWCYKEQQNNTKVDVFHREDLMKNRISNFNKTTNCNRACQSEKHPNMATVKSSVMLGTLSLSHSKPTNIDDFYFVSGIKKLPV